MVFVTEPVCCRVSVPCTTRLLDKATGVMSELQAVYGLYTTNASEDNHITRNCHIYPHISILASSIHDTMCVHIHHKMKSLVLCELLVYETVKPWDALLCRWG